MSFSQPGLGVSVPVFEPGFGLWDSQDLFSFFQTQSENPIISTSGSDDPEPHGQSKTQPINSNPGSDATTPCFNQNSVNSISTSDDTSRTLNQNSAYSNLGSDDTSPTLNQNSLNSNSGSDEQARPVSIIDERKKRRMISNRESARRSRMRKQKHLENLRNHVNRLKIENQHLSNQLRFVTYHSHVIRKENDKLRSESVFLQRRLLAAIHQILIFRQLQQHNSSAWPCNTIPIPPISEQHQQQQQLTPSLITQS